LTDSTKEKVMNWNTIEGRWKELKGNIKEQWGELTDDEIDQAEGKRDILLGKLQAKYGIAREEAEKQLDSWAEKLNLD
tara:strand:- start:740 stop:973 length:234 start_codon:yes stop_codon:yes gene_type:complete